MSKVKLVAYREFARMQGVSLQAVQRAIQSGRISTVKDSRGKPKINPETAAQEWIHNTDPSQQRKPVGKPEAAEPDPEKPNSSSLYQSARAIREQYVARTAQLEYERKAGKLVEADKIKVEAYNAARLTRDTLLNIPNKIAHELAVETDPAKIHLKLTDSINQALEELVAEGVRRMEARE